nr:MAG TPA: hypothetical protein [Bacteriophage sp.]
MIYCLAMSDIGVITIQLYHLAYSNRAPRPIVNFICRSTLRFDVD